MGVFAPYNPQIAELPRYNRAVSARIIDAKSGFAEAIARLRRGELVAFPTETVYGLGANALDASAVARIYAAKGRPATNPLIVHIANTDIARTLALEWPETAERLAAQFWPGPLTVVVQRRNTVPGIVTAGGETVGLRIPAHPVALELLRTSGLPIAAPSANRSEEVSPTTAQHVADSLGPYIDDLLILDGGPCTVGLESTVLDVTTDPPRILRPGMVTQTQLTEVLGDITTGQASSEIARSPGQMKRHYAPRVPVVLWNSFQPLATVLQPGDAFLTLSPPSIDLPSIHTLAMPASPTKYAASLYAALRTAEAAGVLRIVIEEPPHTPEWYAIHDRLRRAAVAKQEETE